MTKHGNGVASPLAWSTHVLVVLSLAVLGASIVHSVWLSTLSGIGPDAGYYLMKAQVVERGKVPYADFKSGYGPLFFYLQAVYFQVFDKTLLGLLVELWTHHVLVLAIVLFILRRVWELPVWVLCLSSATYLMALANFEGFYFVLEPIIGLYGWAAIGLALWSGYRLKRMETAGGKESLWSTSVAAGLATVMGSVAMGIKQSGTVFALLALLLPHAVAGRFFRPVFFAGLLGSAVPLGLFFSVYPNTVQAFFNDSVLGIMLYAIGKRVELEPLEVRLSWALDAAWIPVSLVGVALVAMWGKNTSSRDRRLILLLSLAGLMLWMPVFVHPYRHYLLSPLPFAIFALGYMCALIAGKFQTRPLRDLCRLAIGVAIFSVVNVWLYNQSLPVEDSLRRTLIEERDVAKWIRDSANGVKRISIVPNALQYYYLSQTESFDEAYEFLQDPNSLWYAARENIPVFVIDRSDGRYVRYYERKLGELGYSRVSTFNGRHSFWLRRSALDPTPPIPVLRPYPKWLQDP